MSLLLRAAAAAARRGLGRPPSAAAHGRRTMVSSSTSARTETMEGAWMIRLAFYYGLGVFANRALEANMRHIAREAHKEEIKSIREEMKALRASNDVLLALLNSRRTRDQ